FLSYVLGPVEQADAPLYVVLNAALETIEFMLPTLPQYSRWTALLETAPEPRLGAQLASGSKLQARPRSILVFSASPCGPRCALALNCIMVASPSAYGLRPPSASM